MTSEWTIETTDENFERDVIERSATTPVVVDFWAEWCAPCRMLAPVLETVIDKRQGEFVLVKAETERCQTAAGSFQVSSIPAVYLVYQGQVVDFFAGVLPEAEIEGWLDQSKDRFKLLEAEALEAEAPAQAAEIYREFLEHDPNAYPVMIGLARALLLVNEQEEAAKWIEKLESRGFLEPDAEKVKAQLELTSQDHGDIATLRQQSDENPDDIDLQLQLAKALMAQGTYEEALELCLKIIAQEKTGRGEEAKQLMLDVFRVWSDEDQVREFRKRLSMLLY